MQTNELLQNLINFKHFRPPEMASILNDLSRRHESIQILKSDPY